MGGDLAELCRQQVTAELIMSLTEKECRSALLMLAYASTSLTGDEDDEDDDTGLNNIQAAIAEDAARTAIRAVLAETRGIAVPAPALEVYRRGVRSVHETGPRSGPDQPDNIA